MLSASLTSIIMWIPLFENSFYKLTISERATSA
jgi:hypothetical protein